MKKLLVVAIVAGFLGLSGLGCNKDTKTSAHSTEVKASTVKSGGSTKM